LRYRALLDDVCMSIEPWLTDFAQLSPDAIGPDQPLCIVDLNRCADAAAPALPACPVIGIGPADHPWAAYLDTVVEPPVTVEALVSQIVRAPRAAAAAVQLIRVTASLPIADALVVESLTYAMLQGSAEYAAWLQKRSVGPALAPGTVQMIRDDDRLELVLNRPDALNAIDRPMRDTLHAGFLLAALDPAIRRVSLRAKGRAFSIGGDLGEFGTTRDPATAHAIRCASLPAAALVRFDGEFSAQLHGPCVGAGIELAAFAQQITATPGTWFQLPELAMGLIPGAGGCVSLPRRIGRQRAALMILSGRRIPLSTALAWGLVDHVVDDDPVDPGRTQADGTQVLARR